VAIAVTLTVEPVVQSVTVAFAVPAGMNRVSIRRVGPSGAPAYVRGWEEATVTPGSTLSVRDFEAPIGFPLTYTVTAWADATPATTDTGTAATEIPDGGCEDTWLTDLARPMNTQRVVIEGLPELAYQVDATVHAILGRRTPIVASDIADTPTFELSFLTDDADSRDKARASLGNGVPVLLRSPPENGIGSVYFSVLGFREQRIVKAAREDDRRFVVNCVQVTRPDPILYLPIPPATYASVKSNFATYADLNAERENYDAVLYDYEGAEASDIVPWPPVDV